MQGEMADASNQVFRQLNDADLKFGIVKNEQGRARRAGARRRSQRCCTRPTATVRKTAFHQYYAQFTAHENTLAATLTGSVQRDVYYAKARGLSRAPWRRRCSPTTCRWRSTTT